MGSKPDYYAILQVDPRAEREVIQAAYRRLAAKYHPDVNPSRGAVARMKSLNAAYEVLSDPARRSAYDRSRAGHPRQERARRVSSRLRQPGWLLPLMLVILFLGLRFNPRLLLMFGLIFLLFLLVQFSGRPR